ncbi:hypothetical protein ACFVTF_36360 [Kitasatospora sp. NPDC057940]|uniref:hypothetical protein n=1 Tax=Kitasatospora sp. NPDC057940 TaxID=3346285 RepID=UPI0036DE2AF5
MLIELKEVESRAISSSPWTGMVVPTSSVRAMCSTASVSWSTGLSADRATTRPAMAARMIPPRATPPRRRASRWRESSMGWEGVATMTTTGTWKLWLRVSRTIAGSPLVYRPSRMIDWPGLSRNPAASSDVVTMALVAPGGRQTPPAPPRRNWVSRGTAPLMSGMTTPRWFSSAASGVA